ncbi:12005_t:CDS:2, partial [Cetraspora pellucida]
AGALLAIGLVNTGVRNENDPAFALLSENIENDVRDLLLPLVSDNTLNMEIASLAALSLGLVFVGS